MKYFKKPGTNAWLKQTLKNKRVKRLSNIINLPIFGRLFVLLSLLVLTVTTVIWSVLGARLQYANADQLVNPRLFQNSNTFQNALLPGTHTFLIKWPLFYLIKILGYSSSAYNLVTVGVVLATVAILAFILYKIDRRPLVFGTLCLALASVMLLVPAVPTAGAILPVNMAMVATRNLEYVLYIAALILLIKTKGLKNKEFWLGVILLSLLMASDRLFLNLSIGGALLALTVYALRKGWNLVSLSVDWLVGGVLAALGAIVILWALSANNVTQIASTSAAGPYGLVNSFHNLVLGVFYGGLGILTNFGANPAFDATIAKHIPHVAASRLLGVSGPSFLINLLILLAGLVAAWRLLRISFAFNRNEVEKIDRPANLAIWLIWTSVAAFLVFIFSNHNYTSDARYLTIMLFAAFIAMAAYGRQINYRGEVLVGASVLILISILLGLVTNHRVYSADKAALEPIQTRNTAVAEVLQQHPVKTLVGDYWRVIPIKQTAGNRTVNIMPFSGCFTPRDTLSSGAWQTDLNNNSFAYLLSLDRNLTDYPNCSLNQVIAKYGRPNSSVLIAGTLSSPKELLLFYDRGIHKSAPKIVLKTPSTVLPISLDELPYTNCMGPTIMNIVAHEDDDLLFMSPNLIHDVQAGHCVRTVYITAGDAGRSQFYWLSRQLGSQAAYSKMLGSDDIWVDRVVKLTDQEYATISNPRGNQKVSLVFLHLPDGGVKGQGFAATHNQSLAKLQSGSISMMNSVDGQSDYSSEQLTAVLTSLMQVYQPTVIRTQANFTGSRYPDHSDHITVGQYTKQAYAGYEAQHFEGRVTIPIEFYIGYPIHQMPVNVSGDDLQIKKLSFYAYGGFDKGVCSSDADCARNPAYYNYLDHQYTNPY